MKILLRTILALLVIVVLAIAGLFMYLNDERIRAMVVPQVEEALGREVRLERIGITLFRTFPDFGLVLEGFSIPDDQFDVVSFDELVVSVQLMPLFRGEVNVNELMVSGAQLAYIVLPDGTTNFDFLFEDSEEVTEAPTSTMTIDLKKIDIRSSTIRYFDFQNDSEADLTGIDALMTVRVSEVIHMDMDARVAGVGYASEGTRYLAGLPIALRNTLEIDMEQERVSISQGNLSIRGLELDLTGQVSDWSQDLMLLDLKFASRSDNFGALLDLVPDAFKSYLEGIDTRGALQLSGEIGGTMGEDVMPDFNIVLAVQDGYLKHPDAGKPIEDVQIDLTATNDRIHIGTVKAKADVNIIDMNGVIDHPLDQDRATFEFLANIRLDASTIKEFYPIDTDTLELRGMLSFDGAARGRLNDVENAAISGLLKLDNGYLRHKSLPNPVENVTIETNLTATDLRINTFSARSGRNTLEATGRVRNYLGDAPNLELQLKGNLVLDEIDQYYSLDEFMIAISGLVQADLALRGPMNEFDRLDFSGNAQFSNVSVLGDSLPAPITGVNGMLTFSNNDVQLRNYTMSLGDSDFALNGRLSNWKNLFDKPGDTTPARLTATYRARKLNIDEFVDWDEENDEPLIIELPNLISQLQANIDSLVVMGIPITKIAGQGETDPGFLRITSATAEMFGGKANGRFEWEIYQPDYTFIHFIGGLDDLRAEDFFSEFRMGGEKNFANFITGGFSAQVDYKSGMGSNLSQDSPTIVANGSFGIARARLRNHPTQLAVARLLNMPEFNDLSMDTWTARFSINEGVMTLTDMNLTSRDAGLTINGTQHLVTNEVNYKLRVRLPEQYAQRLSGILNADAIEALKQSDGIILLPLVVTGTTESPRVGLDTDVVQSMITEYLRRRGTDQLEDAARRLLRGIRGN